MLGHYIVGFLLNPNRIQGALADESRRHRRFHEIVDVRRNQNAVTAAVERMAGAPDPLNRARDAFRRRDHHHEIDRADIDPHFQARRANDRAQFAVLQPVLHFEPHAAIERGVMDLDLRRPGRKRSLGAIRLVPRPSGHW